MSCHDTVSKGLREVFQPLLARLSTLIVPPSLACLGALGCCALVAWDAFGQPMTPACGARDLEILIRVYEDGGAVTPTSVKITATNLVTGIAISDTVTSETNVLQECDWVAETNNAGNDNAGAHVLKHATPYQLQFTQLGMPGKTIALLYMDCVDPGLTPPSYYRWTRFHCPRADDIAWARDVADIHINYFIGYDSPRIEIMTDWNPCPPRTREPYNEVVGESWIIPHHDEKYCGDYSLDQNVRSGVFVTEQIPANVFNGPFVGDGITVPSSHTWDFGATTVLFSKGETFTVKGTLRTSGTTFSALTASDGWGGLAFGGGSGLLLNTHISGVGGSDHSPINTKDYASVQLASTSVERIDSGPGLKAGFNAGIAASNLAICSSGTTLAASNGRITVNNIYWPPSGPLPPVIKGSGVVQINGTVGTVTDQMCGIPAVFSPGHPHSDTTRSITGNPAKAKTAAVASNDLNRNSALRKQETTAGHIASTVHPNPFSDQADIDFVVLSAGNVRLAVFDMLGRRVALLTDRRYEAGRHSTTLRGAKLPPRHLYL